MGQLVRKGRWRRNAWSKASHKLGKLTARDQEMPGNAKRVPPAGVKEWGVSGLVVTEGLGRLMEEEVTGALMIRMGREKGGVE